MDRLAIFAMCLASVFARNLHKEIGKVYFKDGIANVPDVDISDEEMMSIINNCNSTFPTPSEYILELNETGMYPTNANRDSKCYLFCVFTRLKVLDEKGNIDTSGIGELVTAEEQDLMNCDSFKKCLTAEKEGKDACEQTYERVSCLVKEKIKHHAADGKNQTEKIC